MNIKNFMAELLHDDICSSVSLLAPSLQEGEVYNIVIGIAQKAAILTALQHTKGDIVKAAEFLGLPEDKLRFLIGFYVVCIDDVVKIHEKEIAESAGTRRKSFVQDDGSTGSGSADSLLASC